MTHPTRNASRSSTLGRRGLVLLIVGVLAGTACRSGSNAEPGGVAAAPLPPDPAPPTALAPELFPAPSRAVAPIVSPRWQAEDTRDDDGEAQRVMRALGVRAGMRVADIGAGDGYYAVRLAPRVGPTGRVYAEDITPRYLDLLRERIDDGGFENVIVVEGTPHDPRLPAATVDLAIFIHMYHEIEQPFALLHTLSRSMRPDGRVAIYEPDVETQFHGTPRALLRCELEAVGYRQQRVDPMGANEYLAIFTVPDARRLMPPDSIAARLTRGGCGGPRP